MPDSDQTNMKASGPFAGLVGKTLIPPSIRIEYVVIAVIAFLPLIFALMTWDMDGHESSSAFALRYLSIPVMIGELFVIVLAMRNGFEIRQGLQNIPKFSTYLLLAWSIFAIAAVANAGAQMPLSVFSTARYMIHGLFFASTIYLLGQSRKPATEHWIAIFAVGGVAYVLALTLFALIVWNSDNFPWMLRMPTGTNIRQIGYYSAITGLAPLSLLLYGKRRVVLSAVALAAIVMFVSWTGSRGALLGLVLGAILALLLMQQKPTFMRALLAAGAFAAGLAASLPLPTPHPTFGLMRMIESSQAQDVTTGRTDVWKHTISEIKLSPMIGHGSGTFNQNMKSKYGFDFNHPHQFALQYAYDWGIIGALFAILMLAAVVLSLWRIANARIGAAGYLGISSCFVILIIAAVDGALFYPLSIVMAVGMMAPAIADSLQSKQKTPMTA